METRTLLSFCGALLICIVLHISILFALFAGLVIFLLYGLRRGIRPRALAGMCLSGVKTARNILITFLLIGILTALWRAAGTIPSIICCAAGLMRPSIFLLMTFWLNCAVSLLTGTAFGTAATMGVICSAMAASMGLSPTLVGGAVLSGAYVGDRCSPVSTSALLIAELTHTGIYDNIRAMTKTALVPFGASSLLYLLLGQMLPAGESSLDIAALFAKGFQCGLPALLPAGLIVVLSLFRIPVKRTMLASIAAAVPLCLFVQGVTLSELLSFALLGYRAADPSIAQLLNGGGVVSMLKVAAIVLLSSAYAGIFQGTGLLQPLQTAILQWSRKTTPYAAVLATAVFTGMVACNQTLTILLTHQLCRETGEPPETLALDLEDTAAVVAALIPWSIAGGVPLASIGAPTASLLAACFLYLLPLWGLLRHRRHPLGMAGAA